MLHLLQNFTAKLLQNGCRKYLKHVCIMYKYRCTDVLNVLSRLSPKRMPFEAETLKSLQASGHLINIRDDERNVTACATNGEGIHRDCTRPGNVVDPISLHSNQIGSINLQARMIDTDMYIQI